MHRKGWEKKGATQSWPSQEKLTPSVPPLVGKKVTNDNMCTQNHAEEIEKAQCAMPDQKSLPWNVLICFLKLQPKD